MVEYRLMIFNKNGKKLRWFIRMRLDKVNWGMKLFMYIWGMMELLCCMRWYCVGGYVILFLLKFIDVNIKRVNIIIDNIEKLKRSIGKEECMLLKWNIL